MCELIFFILWAILIATVSLPTGILVMCWLINLSLEVYLNKIRGTSYAIKAIRALDHEKLLNGNN